MFLQKSNKLITDKCFVYCRTNCHNELIDLMNLYFMKEDENSQDLKKCYVCLNTTEQDKFINGVCKCNTDVHTHCLQKIIKIQREKERSMERMKCKICNFYYDYNYDLICVRLWDNKTSFAPEIFFPEKDFYPTPLMTKNYYFVNSIKDKLKMSMFYLCIPQFIKNTNLATKEEFNEFIKEQMRYLIIIKEEDKYKLCENFPSNYLRKYNEKKYYELEKIINNKINN